MNKLILIALVALLFAGCTKKNTPGPGPTTTSATITGKWYYKADTTTEYRNGVLQSIDTLSYNHTDYMQLNQDKSGVLTSFGVPTSFTYTMLVV